MELSERMTAAGRALDRLTELTAREKLSEVERDGMIQRFEFCFEILWKCGRDYLLKYEGIDAASPKKVIRFLREAGVFDDEETELAIKMTDDRNMTAHTYDEKLAEEISARIRDYEPLMRKWYNSMKR